MVAKLFLEGVLLYSQMASKYFVMNIFAQEGVTISQCGNYYYENVLACVK